jgi:hypothetical protein
LFDSRQEEEEDVFVFFERSRLLLGFNVPSIEGVRGGSFPGVKLTNGLQLVECRDIRVFHFTMYAFMAYTQTKSH